jgi:SAM-dependent methyltransferase
MDDKYQTECDQATRWNGPSGSAWVEAQDLIDQMLRPFEDLLVEQVCTRPDRQVLDVGCGTGGTTVAVARRLDPGRVVGIDLSEPMVAAARARAERLGVQTSFVRADAQAHRFEPPGFDAIMSRFGVMFFADPVRAFENLRRAANPGAELRCVVWRGGAENPFMTTADRAAAALLSNLPAPAAPHAPGRFALADRDRTAAILADSGWSEIDLRPVDPECTLPEPALRTYITRFGPLGMVAPDLDEATLDRVTDAVRAVYEPYVHGTEVRYTAACWLVCARA